MRIEASLRAYRFGEISVLLTLILIFTLPNFGKILKSGIFSSSEFW